MITMDFRTGSNGGIRQGIRRSLILRILLSSPMVSVRMETLFVIHSWMIIAAGILVPLLVFGTGSLRKNSTIRMETGCGTRMRPMMTGMEMVNGMVLNWSKNLPIGMEAIGWNQRCMRITNLSMIIIVFVSSGRMCRAIIILPHILGSRTISFITCRIFKDITGMKAVRSVGTMIFMLIPGPQPMR